MRMLLIFLLSLTSLTVAKPTDWRAKLPEPVLSEHTGWIDFYYDAWRIADLKKQQRPLGWHFDDAFDPEVIYSWDQVFITFYAKYVQDAHPQVTKPMTGIDQIYSAQHADGYLPYKWGYTGNERVQTPIYALSEWSYFNLVADTTRLRRVLPIITREYFAVKARHGAADGAYTCSRSANAMDDRPHGARIIDLTCQQAMEALLISRYAGMIDSTATRDKMQKEYEFLKNAINAKMWSETDQFYTDLRDLTGDVKVNYWTVGSFWAYLAEVASVRQGKALAAALQDPNNFKTPHQVPSLGKKSSGYQAGGGYWRGSVWVPTSTMTIKGLEVYGYHGLAHEIAVNHLDNMYLGWKKSGTINEHYWQGGPTGMGKTGFCGWSGTTPIATLIENVMGIQVNAAQNKTRWRIRLTEEHGLKNLGWGKNWEHRVDLVAKQRTAQTDAVILEINSNWPFTLEVELPYGRQTIAVKAEQNQQFNISRLTTQVGTLFSGKKSCKAADWNVFRVTPDGGTTIPGLISGEAARRLDISGRTSGRTAVVVPGHRDADGRTRAAGGAYLVRKLSE